MYKTESEFEKKLTELEERLKCVKKNIANINEKILLLYAKRNIFYKRKADLMEELYKLVDYEQPTNKGN